MKAFFIYAVLLTIALLSLISCVTTCLQRAFG